MFSPTWPPLMDTKTYGQGNTGRAESIAINISSPLASVVFHLIVLSSSLCPLVSITYFSGLSSLYLFSPSHLVLSSPCYHHVSPSSSMPAFLSRHGGARKAGRSHLCEDAVKPLQWAVEMKFYPAGRGGHRLASERSPQTPTSVWICALITIIKINI